MLTILTIYTSVYTNTIVNTPKMTDITIVIAEKYLDFYTNVKIEKSRLINFHAVRQARRTDWRESRSEGQKSRSPFSTPLLTPSTHFRPRTHPERHTSPPYVTHTRDPPPPPCGKLFLAMSKIICTFALANRWDLVCRESCIFRLIPTAWTWPFNEIILRNNGKMMLLFG